MNKTIRTLKAGKHKITITNDDSMGYRVTEYSGKRVVQRFACSTLDWADKRFLLIARELYNDLKKQLDGVETELEVLRNTIF